MSRYDYSQNWFDTYQDFSTTPAGGLIFAPKNSIKSSTGRTTWCWGKYVKLDKPARLIIRLLFGLMFGNISKYWDGNAVYVKLVVENCIIAQLQCWSVQFRPELRLIEKFVAPAGGNIWPFMSFYVTVNNKSAKWGFKLWHILTGRYKPKIMSFCLLSYVSLYIIM